jgi:hypothetical protein
MPPVRLTPVLVGILLVVGIGVACGGATTEDDANAPVGSGGSAGFGEDAGSDGNPATPGGSGGSGAHAGTGGDSATVVGIRELEFSRTGAADFCIDAGQVVHLVVEWQGESDSMSLVADVFDDWDNAPGCDEGVWARECIPTMPVGPATLSERQARELTALVAALPEDRCELDPEVECYFCLITTLVINGTTYSDPCCGTQLSPAYDDAFAALAEFVDELAAEVH